MARAHYHRVPPDRKDTPSKGGVVVWEPILRAAPPSDTWLHKAMDFGFLLGGVWWGAPLGKLPIPPHMETGLFLKPRPIPPPLSSKNVPSSCGGTHRMIHINAHIKPRTAPRRPTPTSAVGGGPARCAHLASALFRPGVVGGHAPLRATLCARDMSGRAFHLHMSSGWISAWPDPYPP